MKKNIIKITTFLFAIALVSCSSDNKVIDDVYDNTVNGAWLRTTNVGSLNYDRNDKSTAFDITIEEQDSQKGDLLSEVNVFVSFTDNKDDGVDNSKAEVLLNTIPASEFTDSQFNLPQTSINVTLQEALTTLGLVDGQFDGGDTFVFRLEVVLTDGRSYSSNDVNGNVAAIGGFYSSPYAYNVGVKCIPPTPIDGDYVLDLIDTYGDGWDGAFITVTIDGVSTDYTISGAQADAAEYTVTVPPGTAELIFTYSSGNFESEHVFEIIAPNGAVAAESPGIDGEIVLNICV